MDPILLKTTISIDDINALILNGVNDMDINQDKRNEIKSEAEQLSPSFVNAISYHLQKGENPDASYAFQIAVEFNKLIELYRQIFSTNHKKDLLVAFGISAIWMSIFNGLDAESGIMPNHPFKREIANCIRSITEILDEKKTGN
ncbi:hypothetical protein GCQ56_06565 [Marinifilum sp. N1E240]|uniref:hypothetical protein n=1 Tax=Marinifilum sp. N1E240 TaxID=2608082 RepID=UPI00128E144B|nr:hypothetical protein [Marinifilum sp. N1E240]MPQ46672.1 hypothetical protein [Marinifilum sp. N1E240]